MTRFSSLTLIELLDAFAASEPTPAGGSASALAAATGASLLIMAATLPKTRSGATDEAADLAAAAVRLRPIRDALVGLIDRDAEAYAGISGSTAWNFHTSGTVVADDYPYRTDTSGVVTVNGAATSGVIEVPDDADLFKVALVAGTTYTFTLQRTSGTGGLTNPYLQLYGTQPNANTSPPLITQDDDSGGETGKQFHFCFRALRTTGGTKAEISPPSSAI